MDPGGVRMSLSRGESKISCIMRWSKARTVVVFARGVTRWSTTSTSGANFFPNCGIRAARRPGCSEAVRPVCTWPRSLWGSSQASLPTLIRYQSRKSLNYHRTAVMISLLVESLFSLFALKTHSQGASFRVNERGSLPPIRP